MPVRAEGHSHLVALGAGLRFARICRPIRSNPRRLVHGHPSKPKPAGFPFGRGTVGCVFGRRRPTKTVGVTDAFTLLLMPGEDEPLHVRFEPIGPKYDIAAGDHLRISVRSPSADPIEVVSGANWVTIWPALAADVRATNSSGEDLKFLI